MQYQLVIQIDGDSLDDYDLMIAFENELIEVLGDSASVDGHDVGSGEINIFIFTSDPARTFGLVRPVLQRTQRFGSVTVAYRAVDGDDYTVIWPEGSNRRFRVA
ncbi:MAG: hypothetical protein HY000_41485 [Planctomycetes bacterium]|nr:hypothetical protein [Planctomycetota bacterium]